MADTDKDDSGGWAVAKGALMALGGLVALGLVISVLKPLVVLGVLGGVAYLGYRVVKGGKSLGSAKTPKSLTASRDGGGDFEAKMRELEKMERKLDAQLRGDER